MSKEGERASVLKTTKVRTKLKGDGSWMQRLSEPQSETEEEKPWMAEVVNQLNGAPIDTSPVASPTSKTPPPPTRPAEDGAPSPGYLSRGIFTKTDTKPAANSSTSNGFSGSTSSFTKRPSESYKRIAPHTVRPTSNLPVQTEDQLSPEEKDKREEAAVNVLKTSSVRQRSYVLSAANKYDCTKKTTETSLTTDAPSFVAKRVVITGNDDSVFTETPSVPKEPAAPSVKGVPPVCVKDVSPVCVKDVSPVCVKDVSPVCVKDVSPVLVKDVSPVSVKDVSPVCVKDVSPVSVKDFPSVCVKDVSSVSVEGIHVCVKDVHLSTPVIVDTPAGIDPYESMKPGRTKVATELSPESSVLLKVVSPVSPVPYKPVKTDPAPVDTLTALSDTLISFDTRLSSSRVPDPVWTETAEPEDRLHGEPIPQLMVDDLLSLTNGLEEELVKPIPPSPGSWSQELLSGSDSVNENVLEALADDGIPIDTNKSRSSDSDSPWDRWSAPTVYKEKEDSSRSYSRTLDSSANQRPKSPDTESKKCFVYLKEYVDVTDLTKHNTRDNDPDYVTSSSTSHSYSSPSSYTRSTMTSACTYCGEQVGNDAKITIEHLNISCHPACFKCGVCSKPMGDFLSNMFLHKGKVHCESCYANVL
ncbi:zinc finger protein 185-like [Salvelinus fontinalis]|uniref:zinc finger protein 185-like n=1 Tax=Salvelinus fontinalis TaxID=8038 RepID=UPI002484DF76|nr:zinc finger protein 185-like [Salvelinus fontinalis]